MLVNKRHYDKLTVIVALLFLFILSIFIYRDISAKQFIIFILGTAIGISLIHSGFGFTGAWREYILHRKSTGIRAQIIVFILASIIMFPMVAGVFTTDGVFSAALGPIAFSVLFGAFLFGIGMQMGGGCGSGTLSTTGQGQVDMLVTIVFFIVGSYIGTLHLQWWTSFANTGSFSFIKFMGWQSALVIQVIVLLLIYKLISKADLNRNGTIDKLTFRRDTGRTAVIFGKWPLLWGSLLIALLAVATLVVTGHTWSITFAFGLWGAKIWQALGGNPEIHQYWSAGYPRQALNSSILADVTSVMNIGILLGAALASALANKFSPQTTLNYRRILTAILGGILLGYGARLAFGCNIGALLAGMTTGSGHAWIWLAGGVTGNVLGIKIRHVIERTQN